MIYFSSSLWYIIIVFIVFYVLRRKHRYGDTPAIIDGLIALFWIEALFVIFIYYCFKFINDLAQR